MKNLSSYSPKRDTWAKLLIKRDFNAQVEQHRSSLPSYGPKDSTWAKIEAGMENKSKQTPWVWLSIAASFLVLLISYALTLVGDRDVVSPQISQTVVNPKQASRNKNNEDVNLDSNKNPGTSMGKSEKKSSIQPRIRESAPMISLEIPEIEFPSIFPDSIILVASDFSESYDSLTVEKELKPTLHEVKISWGFAEEKPRIRTSFGFSEPTQIQAKEVKTPKTGRVFKLGQKN